MIRLPGILLTGGRSTRMGRDKATIVLNGETLAARGARVLGVVCAPLVEVGDGASGLPHVREDPAGSGPLAGLCAGARALASPGPMLLLACDMARVEPPLLRLLAEWPGTATVVPVAGGRRQYACARVGPDALAAAENALAYGRRALAAAFDGAVEELAEAVWGEVAPPDAFADVDTPHDLGSLGSS